ncbi:MAG: hypothetical protein JXQ89_18795 [Pelagimonas sp.]
MVPNFALLLSFDGIGLLRQTPRGWAKLADVPLDSADLTGDVNALRQQAQTLDPTGAQVALIIPNEQIRYLDIADPSGRPRLKDRAVREALDGATPYDVEDLVYDHVAIGRQRMIAAVARETLDEAEGFVRQHGFDPVSFLALAPEGAFEGVVFFGGSVSWLGPDPARPDAPFEIYPADAEALSPLAVLASPAPDTEPVEDPEPTSAPEPEANVEPETTPEPVAASEVPLPEAVAPVVADEPAEPDLGSSPEERPSKDDTAQSVAAVTESETEKRDDQEQLDLGIDHLELHQIAPPRPEPQPVLLPGEDPFGPTPEQSQTSETSSIEGLVATNKTLDILDDLDDLASTVGAGLDNDEFESKLAAALDEAPKAVPQEDPTAAEPLSTAPPAPTVSADQPASPPRATSVDPTSDLDTPPKSFSDVFSATPPEQTSPMADFSQLRARREAVPPAPRPLELGPDKTDGKPAAPSVSSPQPKADFDTAARAAAAAAAMRQNLVAEKSATSSAATPVQVPNKPVAPPPPAPQTPTASKPSAGKPKEISASGMTPLARIKPVKKAFHISEVPGATPAETAPPIEKPRSEPASRADKALAGFRKKAKAEPIADTAPALELEDESDKFTVFGARNRPPVGGKPRFLGLMLTAGLLLFLVGIAAWATVFLDEGVAGLFKGKSDVEIADTGVPQAQPTPVAPPATAAVATNVPDPAPSEEVQLASLSTGEDLTPPLAALPSPAPLRALTPEEAAATYAATGVWQRAPAEPHNLPLDEVDSLYIASIDPKVQGSDAVALPNPQNFVADPQIANPGLPPPAGVTFDIDSRGLVRATPEGAVTPDGFRVFTGPPPVVPPLRGAPPLPTLADPSQAANTASLAAFRPQARPSDLIEQRERATHGGISIAELGAIRPVLRPRTEQEVAVEEAPEATALAVSRSLIPVGRPRNMAAIVDRAEKAPQPVQTAAVAPRTVTPSIPSGASVSRAATVNNAINLNKINLIGVFGTPSNRRALVRLPNGRYQKVKIGDRLDGGRVATISESELRYTKSGRNVTLKMPRS